MRFYILSPSVLDALTGLPFCIDSVLPMEILEDAGNVDAIPALALYSGRCVTSALGFTRGHPT